MLFEFWWKICHDVGLQCSSFCRLAAECVPTSFSWFTLINHPDSKGRRNVVKQCEIKLWCMFSICRIVTEGEVSSGCLSTAQHGSARLGSVGLDVLLVPGSSFRASWVVPSFTRQWKHSVQVQENTSDQRGSVCGWVKVVDVFRKLD